VDVYDDTDWESTRAMIHRRSRGETVVNLVTLEDIGRWEVSGSFLNPVTLLAVKEWAYRLPDGSNYSVRVGELGLGITSSGFPTKDPPPTIPQRLKSSVPSMLLGLHMGSVAFGQLGSLVLGGYERNRALGSVGAFRFDAYTYPIVFLLDVLLGVQIGASPFDRPEDVGSVWQGVAANEGDRAEYITNAEGLKPGTAFVIPDPTVPYIYPPQVRVTPPHTSCR
jgi:hypothetical protein